MEVVGYVNVQQNMTDPQVAMCARIIAKKFHWYTVDDITNCFLMGCGGDFGQLFGRLDGTILTGWLDQYESHRVQSRAKEKAKDTSGPNNIYQENLNLMKDERVRNTILDAVDKVEERSKMVFHMGPAVRATREPTKYDEWIALFDLIYNKQPAVKSVHRSISRYGLRLTINDFLNFKYNQLERVTNYLNDRNQTLKGH